jgi:hypothetical protein
MYYVSFAEQLNNRKQKFYIVRFCLCENTTNEFELYQPLMAPRYNTV